MTRPPSASARLVTAAACALLLAVPLVAWAQAAAPAAYFPLDPGRQWTYRLRIKVGKQSKTIEYTSRVVGPVEVESVGTCSVIESRSDKRVMQVDWYQRRPGAILNVMRQEGASEEARERLGERVFLDLEAIAVGLADGGAATPDATRWTWSLPDGSVEGTSVVRGVEGLHLRNFGMLDCLLVVSTGRHEKGGKVRIQERRMWLAPGLGLVKEYIRVKKESGEVLIETDAVLIRHESP